MKNIYIREKDSPALSYQQAKDSLGIIARGEANNEQIKLFLNGYILNQIEPIELAGFRDAMFDLATLIDLSEFDPIDVCGTGGDGKDTFNISTTSAFVVAGAAQKVAKHGNHGVSSSVGSSTVLEYLGVKFSNDESFLKSKIETSGICFLHAPLFHPAMRHVGPIRKELGVKTFFNMLGPLLNPAKVRKQLIGVYSQGVQILLKDMFHGKEYGILHDLGGYDEISLTDNFLLNSSRGNLELLGPDNLGFSNHIQSDLFSGNTAEESAKILTNILQNKGTIAQTEVVLANAATALYIADSKLNWPEAVDKARESLKSGKAFESFKKFIAP